MQDEHRYGKEKEEENQNDENIFKKKKLTNLCIFQMWF